MTCCNCATVQRENERLEAEVAFLKSEYGLAVEATKQSQMARALKLKPGAARVLMSLYQAKGRTVQTWALRENCATENAESGVVSVYVWHLRQALGQAAVLNDWGNGYHLSAEAIAAVSEILGVAKPTETRRTA